MFNACPRCGEYRPDKAIDPSGPYAVCPACGYRHPFRQMPLLLIGGPSGAGKSAMLLALAGQIDSAVLLESDLLWGPQYDRPESRYREFFEVWLRMAKNIGQSGRPVALFGAGFAVPENIEPCIERRYFSAVHYLALVCAPQALETRLEARPSYRESGGDAFISRQLQFSAWLTANAERTIPHVTLVDTTSEPIARTAKTVAAWIANHIT